MHYFFCQTQSKQIWHWFCQQKSTKICRINKFQFFFRCCNICCWRWIASSLNLIYPSCSIVSLTQECFHTICDAFCRFCYFHEFAIFSTIAACNKHMEYHLLLIPDLNYSTKILLCAFVYISLLSFLLHYYA